MVFNSLSIMGTFLLGTVLTRKGKLSHRGNKNPPGVTALYGGTYRAEEGPQVVRQPEVDSRTLNTNKHMWLLACFTSHKVTLVFRHFPQRIPSQFLFVPI